MDTAVSGGDAIFGDRFSASQDCLVRDQIVVRLVAKEGKATLPNQSLSMPGNR
jgi:hypothetical protein